ncbi:PDZ domain-containing protein [Roseimicrobium sp. ORNL1]|uniref:PDZ domain-containing protein n=1 Tax=Roseimicrobium sp. ORNL1 TaxID=2711231 RepID=UPI0013E11C0C|nr:PDZ domain-containing protein [Roseimicrobium sp. ORNL1]QIF02446.1 PDZ domain-containing protein [Roseimicrobium sp. ORNL1]
MSHKLKKHMRRVSVDDGHHESAGFARISLARFLVHTCVVGFVGASIFGGSVLHGQTPTDSKPAKPQPSPRGKLELKKLPIEVPRLDALVDGLGVHSKYIVQTVKEVLPSTKTSPGGVRTTRRIYERATDCLMVESWLNSNATEVSNSSTEKGEVEKILIFEKDAFYSCNAKGIWTKLQNFAEVRSDLSTSTPYGGSVHIFETLFAAPVLGLKIERIKKSCQDVMKEVAANPSKMSLMADQVGRATDLLMALQERPIRLKDAEMMPMLKMPSKGSETLITFLPENDKLIQSISLTRNGRLAGTCENLFLNEVVDKPTRPDQISRLLSPTLASGQNKKTTNFEAMEREWRALPPDRKAETLGAVLVPSAKGLKVLQVFPESNAKSMGLVPGDEIVAVDGAAVSDISAPMAIKMFVNKNVELTLANGKKYIKP